MDALCFSVKYFLMESKSRHLHSKFLISFTRYYFTFKNRRIWPIHKCKCSILASSDCNI